MGDRSKRRYGSFWDDYVTETFPRLQREGPRSPESLEEWRVLNTSDAKFEWPGDEWGDRAGAEAILSSTLAAAIAGDVANLVEIGSGAGRYTTLALERFPEAAVYSFDVSGQFEQALRERCEAAIREGRLETILLDENPSTMLSAIEERGLLGHIDAFYSFDAMVHVDLHTLVVYFLTAARALKSGGIVAMNVADASSERGFMKLLYDAPGVYSLAGSAGGHFMWVSRDLIRELMPGLGFEVSFTEGNGRDATFVARLVDRNSSSRWLERAGAHWIP